MRQSDSTSARAGARLARFGTVGLLLIGALLPSIAATTFTPDLAPVGWVTRPVLTSNNVRSGNESIFQANYVRGMWSGNIDASDVDTMGNPLDSGPWNADTGTQLTAVSWDTGRLIVTRLTNGTNVPFRYTSLDATQQTALGGKTSGQNTLNFLRGDRSNETPSGANFRARTSVQGDIIHSSVLYWNYASGEQRLFAGGNDGMLHVFDATSGSEVFAYVPSMLMSRLPLLAVNPYVHASFVDGGLTMADTVLGSGTRTLLAGALGGGGKGLFMLDVTSPSPTTEATAATAIKWEITPSSTGFANLGYTYAAPRLARLNSGTPVVIVGNGYVNSGNGHATLLIINADTGALIREVDTGSGSAASPDGLSTPALFDVNGDGKVDYAYAGDIDGNLWRFDLTSSNPASFTVTKLLATAPAQAITSAPVVVPHPLGGQMVIVGTGRMLTAADSTDTSAFYVYGVWDGAPVANASLLAQTVTEVALGSQRLRTVSNNVPNWTSGGNKGWRLTLPAGERVVGDGQYINESRFYFVGTNPTVAAPGAGLASGANWLTEVSYMTGGSPATPVFDINNDGIINSSDNINGKVVVGAYLGAGVASSPVLVDVTGFSVSLVNSQSDLPYTAPAASTDSGVSGGHFDVDFYFTAAGSFSDVKHHHQYDDSYNVTGVNFLNASDPAFNLGSKLPVATPFKVLIMNQYLNPAVQLSVGGAGYDSVKTYRGQATQTDPAALLASMPVYTQLTVNTLIFNLPLNAFASMDWWGDGGPVRAGLIPTQTGCVNKVGTNGSTTTLGPNGERHDGAFTIQLIKDTTPASALELNYAGGGPKYGWRVKAGLVTTYVVAEYSTFWHDTEPCYGQSGWVPNPPQVGPGTKTGTPAAGSQDPTGGTFGVPTGVTIISSKTTVTGDTTVTLVTYSDGKTAKTTTTNNGDGTDTVTTVGRDGSVVTTIVSTAGTLISAPYESLLGSRRINWRELIRQ